MKSWIVILPRRKRRPDAETTVQPEPGAARPPCGAAFVYRVAAAVIRMLRLMIFIVRSLAACAHFR